MNFSTIGKDFKDIFNELTEDELAELQGATLGRDAVDRVDRLVEMGRWNGRRMVFFADEILEDAYSGSGGRCDMNVLLQLIEFMKDARERKLPINFLIATTDYVFLDLMRSVDGASNNPRNADMSAFQRVQLGIMQADEARELAIDLIEELSISFGDASDRQRCIDEALALCANHVVAINDFFHALASGGAEHARGKGRDGANLYFSYYWDTMKVRERAVIRALCHSSTQELDFVQAGVASELSALSSRGFIRLDPVDQRGIVKVTLLGLGFRTIVEGEMLNRALSLTGEAFHRELQRRELTPKDIMPPIDLFGDGSDEDSAEEQNRLEMDRYREDFYRRVLEQLRRAGPLASLAE